MYALPRRPKPAPPSAAPADHRNTELSAAIQCLASIQNQIEERAYQIYLESGLPNGVALEHWLTAEGEVRSWIDTTIQRIVPVAARA